MDGTTATLPGPAAIERIIRLSDPVIRNLQITQCYHELASAMASRLSGGANWCAFATWASRQAGHTIRREDLRRQLARTIDDVLGTHGAGERLLASARAAGPVLGADGLRGALQRVLEPAVVRASDAVARGNLKVFAEIAPVFARFSAERLRDPVPDAGAIARFCETLQPGEPPDGQGYLRQAFGHYYAALFESDARTRAELAFLANLEVGFHEQTRLQPEIAESLELAEPDPRHTIDQVIAVLLPRAGWLTRLRAALGRLLRGPTPLERALAAVLTEIRARMRVLLTAHGLSLGLPHGEQLRLGHDLRANFPASLERTTNAELAALLRRIDPTRDSRSESGAVDWADLPERMHFICDFFRCHHERADLFIAPFLPAQTQALKAGRLPAGEL